MNIPTEVWGLIISHLPLNDLIQVSCVYRDFYRLSRTNSFYVKKLDETKRIFRDRSWIISAYRNLRETFYFTLFRKLLPYVTTVDALKMRKIIEKKLFNAILPFRVWNHIFLCTRSQYESNMCLFCTKIYLRNKKVSKLIEKKLVVDVLGYFPGNLSYGIISDGTVNLFIHTSVNARQKILDENGNFGVLFYEVINSPFMLWKFYLDVLARIVFIYSDKYVIPTILSASNDDCRNHTICTQFTCFGLKTNKVKEIVFKATLKLSKKLAQQPCMSTDYFFIFDVFNTYKLGVDNRN